MAKRYSIEDTTLNDIADAIRNKTGSGQPIKANKMAEAIATISGGGTSMPTQEKRVDIVENATIEITPDKGYTLSKVTANVEVPIPDGYVEVSGTLDITENGEYVVEQYAAVDVKVPTGGADDTEAEALADVIENEAIDFESSRVTKVSQYAFAYKTNLKSVSLPNLRSSNTRVFSNCDSLESLSIPNMTGYTYQYMAAYCGALQSADVSQASYVSSYSFYNCALLKKLEFNRATTIATNAFNGCKLLTVLVLRNSSVVSLGGTSAFTGTPIAGSGGYIYVPAALIDSYKAATNWSTYASKFRAIEDYPNIMEE